MYGLLLSLWDKFKRKGIIVNTVQKPIEKSWKAVMLSLTLQPSRHAIGNYSLMTSLPVELVIHILSNIEVHGGTSVEVKDEDVLNVELVESKPVTNWPVFGGWMSVEHAVLGPLYFCSISNFLHLTCIN